MLSETLLVLCTIDTEEHAKKIAGELVAAKLAACVNLLPSLTSIYRWEGEIEEAKETLMLIKTRRALFERLKDKIVSLHPYSLPEIIALDIAEGETHYLAWIMKETQ